MKKRKDKKKEKRKNEKKEEQKILNLGETQPIEEKTSTIKVTKKTS
jgi:hypothetical protein